MLSFTSTANIEKYFLTVCLSASINSASLEKFNRSSILLGNMRKNQSTPIREQVQSKAIQILDKNPSGLRFGDLARMVRESFPDLKKPTINMYVSRLATDKDDEVCKPSRGFFRIKDETKPETAIQSRASARAEKREISEEFEKR